MNTTTLAGLAKILRDEKVLASDASSLPDVRVTGCACDSRVVRPGDLFVCKGVMFREEFLASAVERGAVAYLCDPAHAAALAATAPGVPALVSGDVRRAMGLVAPVAWGHPDREMQVAGMTGTKGKSTVAYMLRSIVDGNEPYSRASVMGSIETYDGVERLESHNTTPEAPDLWRHLRNALDSGHDPMIMEVSSQGLKYDRTVGLRLSVGAWLNIGRDHISPAEHPDFEDYFASKLKIFSMCDVAVVNLDTDELDRVMAASEAAGEVRTFSATRDNADYWASDVRTGFGTITFTAHTPSWTEKVMLAMPGLFNVDNALCAIAMADIMGFGLDQICDGLSRAHVPGRMQICESSTNHVVGLVDYAHNQLSYQRFFGSVTKEFPGRRISVVLGAPGGKAQERRRELPEEASRWADLLVYTEEDPAREAVGSICAEMAANTPAGQDYEVILDRTRAIRHVVQLAQESPDDWLVCLLAKGNEVDQHIGEKFVPMVPDGEVFARAMHDYARPGDFE